MVGIVRRGQQQGVFRDVDPALFARHLTSATDGAAIQVLTGAPDMTVDKMRALLVSIVDHELSHAPDVTVLSQAGG